MKTFVLIMLSVSNLFTSALLALSLQNGLVTAAPLEGRATTCVAADVAAIKGNVTHPAYFCTFYDAMYVINDLD